MKTVKGSKSCESFLKKILFITAKTQYTSSNWNARSTKFMAQFSPRVMSFIHKQENPDGIHQQSACIVQN
jgi:hypothetical protein